MANSVWYKLIESLKEKNEITTGLTIPYILGAYKILDQNFAISNDSIKELFKYILESEQENVAVLEYCQNIQHYVISLWRLENAQASFQNEIQITNSKGQKRLFLTPDTSKLGKTEVEIIKSLEDIYLNPLKSKNYSWDSFDEEWKQFNQHEINLIKNIKL